MFWKRIFIFGVPVALGLAVAWVFQTVRASIPAREPNEIVLGIFENPGALNPFRPGNALSDRIESCLFETLLERNEKLELEPGLAISWNVSSAARYFFVSDRHAQEALDAIVQAQDRWKDWGIVEVQADNDEVRVGFKDPGGNGPGEIYALFDEEAVLPVRRLEVQVLQSAWDSYQDFRRNALEGGQVRREHLASSSSYVLEIAGATENFLREFKSYYDTNESLKASYRFGEDTPYLYEPELLLSLREGVTWHDGEPFTAEDVLFSYQMSKSQPWNRKLHDAFAKVQSLSAVDGHTVRVLYRELDPLLVEEWALVPMLPRHVLDEKDLSWWMENFERTPVGTGPYRVGRWNPDGGLELERFDEFHQGAPETARLKFVKIDDRVERRMRFLRGEIDSYLLLRGEETPAADGKRFGVAAADAGRVMLVVWNTGRKPFDEGPVRRALAHAIDREALVAEVCPGHGEVARGLFHPASGVTGPESAAPGYEDGLARKFLARAGWFPGADGRLRRLGNELRVVLAIAEGDSFETTAGFLKRNWEAMGVTVEMVKLTGGLESRADNAFPEVEADAILVGVPAPSDWLSFRYGALGRYVDVLGAARTGGEEPVDVIAAEFDGTKDRVERVELCRLLEEVLLEEQGMTCLMFWRDCRVLPRGGFALSRAIGDGHRMEKELEATDAGIDFYLPWWVRK